jgi:hypothetical protein
MVDPSALGKKCGSGAVNPPCLTQSQFLYTSTSACNGATNGCLTAQSDFGNVPPNSFYGPGYFDIDTQVTKTVKIRERMNLQIGAGAYNTLNHPNFGQPSGSATSASIGKITGTVSAGKHLRFGPGRDRFRPRAGAHRKVQLLRSTEKQYHTGRPLVRAPVFVNSTCDGPRSG